MFDLLNMWESHQSLEYKDTSRMVQILLEGLKGNWIQKVPVRVNHRVLDWLLINFTLKSATYISKVRSEES